MTIPEAALDALEEDSSSQAAGEGPGLQALEMRRNKKDNLTAAKAQGKVTGRWTEEEHDRFNEGKCGAKSRSYLALAVTYFCSYLITYGREFFIGGSTFRYTLVGWIYLRLTYTFV